MSRIQSHMEMWSEQLDGENGVIRQHQNDRAERHATLRLLKGVAWVLGPATIVQVLLVILKLAHVIS